MTDGKSLDGLNHNHNHEIGKPRMTLSNEDAWKAARKGQPTPVTDAVRELVESLGALDPAGNATSAICLNLAEQLDANRGTRTGTGLMAASKASRDLAILLQTLTDPSKASSIDELFRNILEGNN